MLGHHPNAADEAEVEEAGRAWERLLVGDNGIPVSLCCTFEAQLPSSWLRTVLKLCARVFPIEQLQVQADILDTHNFLADQLTRMLLAYKKTGRWNGAGVAQISTQAMAYPPHPFGYTFNRQQVEVRNHAHLLFTRMIDHLLIHSTCQTLHQACIADEELNLLLLFYYEGVATSRAQAMQAMQQQQPELTDGAMAA
jgi:hypothetical protein